MTKRQDCDLRDKDWPKGLYCRDGHLFKFKRTVKKVKYRDSWGDISFSEAERQAIRYNLDLADGINPIKKSYAQTVTAIDFAWNTWLPQKKDEVAESTYNRYRAVIQNFQEFLNTVRQPNLAVSKIDYSLAREFIKYRKNTPLMPNGSARHNESAKKGASKGTVNQEHTILKQFLDEALKHGLLKHNPFRDFTSPRPSKDEIRSKHHPLSEEEEARLIKAAVRVDNSRRDDGGPSFADIVKFFCWTGCRDDEFQNLLWTDINFEDHYISIRRKSVTETRVVEVPEKFQKMIEMKVGLKQPSSPLFSNSDLEVVKRSFGIRSEKDLLALRVRDVDLEKGLVTYRQTYEWKPKGTEGDIPMCDKVNKLLLRLERDASSNFVFAYHDGGQCRLKLLRYLEKARKIAGIEGGLRIHDLRHTFAVRLRELGCPLETIMGLMRHAEIQETLIYAPYDLKEGKKMINLLDQF